MVRILSQIIYKAFRLAYELRALKAQDPAVHQKVYTICIKNKFMTIHYLIVKGA